MIIVDAHLDLAYNALNNGRFLTQSIADIRKIELPDRYRGQITATIPEMKKGGIGLVFGTLFVTPSHAKLAVMGEVKRTFRPEFINRIDEIVVFHGLDQKHIASIAKIQLRILEQRLAAQEMTLQVTDAAVAEIAKAGFDPVYGARPLKRAIQQYIENPVARLVLEGKFAPKDVVPVDFRDGRFIFDRVVH